MFDVGFWELAVIGIVALLIVGPEKLPGLARTAGRWAGRAQRMARELRYELEREVDLKEVERLKREIESNELGADIKSAVNDINRGLNQRVSADSPEADGSQGSGQSSPPAAGSREGAD